MPLGRTSPALLGKNHSNRLGRHQGRFIHGLGRIALHNGRAPFITKLLRIGLQFLADQGAQALFGVQDLFQFLTLLFQLILFAPNLHFFELGQVAQFQLQDGLGLGIGNTKALHKNRLGLILGTNNVDDLIDIQIGNQQAFEDM